MGLLFAATLIGRLPAASVVYTGPGLVGRRRKVCVPMRRPTPCAAPLGSAIRRWLSMKEATLSIDAGLWYPALNPTDAEEAVTYELTPKTPELSVETPAVV